MGTKLKNVMKGEHYEGMRLTAVSLVITGCYLPVIAVTVETSPDRLFSLIAYYFIFLGSVESLSLGISNLRTALFEYQAFDEFITRRSDVGDVSGAVSIAANANPTIEFTGVSFTYGGKQILDDVSFRLEGGQTLGLVGSSGCGKSTVMLDRDKSGGCRQISFHR